MRVAALLTVVGLSFEVLMSNGCARRHYTITVREVVPIPAPPRTGTLRGPADLRNLKEHPQAPSARGRPPGAQSAEALVPTTGDDQQRPQSMRGSSDTNVQPDGSIGRQIQGSDNTTEETSQPQVGRDFSFIGRVLLVAGVIGVAVLFAVPARRRIGS
jgi:hypothetical protein